MKTYYFLQINGIKKGPFSLEDLSKSKIKLETLVWRNDEDDWKTAKEFEELQELIFQRPPMTPKEFRANNFLNKVKRKLPKTIILMFLLSLITGTTTSNFAWNSLEEYKIKLEEQREKYKIYLEEIKVEGPSTEPLISTFPVVSERYPGELIFGGDNESNYSQKQLFIFRPFYLINSPIYLSREERDNKFLLVLNLFLSTLAFSTIILFLITTLNFFKSIRE